MIKQGLITEAMADIAGSAPLPPLNNLPQWSRINTLDKARYPKPFLKDRLLPLPNPNDEKSDAMDADQDLDMVDQINPYNRIQHLERSIQFLVVQHKEVLANLHDEIDKLKRDNKELQFRIVMVAKQAAQFSSPPASGESYQRIKKKGSSKGSRKSSVEKPDKECSTASMTAPKFSELDLQDQQSEQQSQVSDEKIEELKVIFLEEEIKELKQGLKEEKHKNNYLTQMLEQAEKQRQQKINQGALVEGPEGSQAASKMSESSHSAGPSNSSKSGTTTNVLPYNATLNPLRVNFPTQPPRPPNFSESEVIIRHLQSVNDKQAHELNQLKSDLRDVLYSHKWTPDAYLLAKAYIAEDDAKEALNTDQKFPKIQLKQPNRKLPDIAYIQKDSVTLPALKSTVGNKAMERRKRTQILQKARLRREVLH